MPSTQVVEAFAGSAIVTAPGEVGNVSVKARSVTAPPEAVVDGEGEGGRAAGTDGIWRELLAEPRGVGMGHRHLYRAQGQC